MGIRQKRTQKRIELIERAVADLDAASLGRILDHPHPRSEVSRQPFAEVARRGGGSIGIGSAVLARLALTPDQCFDLANRHLAGHHPACHAFDGRTILEPKQGAGVAHRQTTCHHEAPHTLGKLEQAEGVGDGRPIFSDPRCQRFLGIGVLGDEALVGLGFLDWVEIFALDVLHQRHLEGAVGSDVPNDRRNLLQARLLGGSPPALSRDELVPTGWAHTHHQRLNDALHLERRSQLFQLLVVEDLAWLVLPRVDVLDGKQPQPLLDRW